MQPVRVCQAGAWQAEVCQAGNCHAGVCKTGVCQTDCSNPMGKLLYRICEYWEKSGVRFNSRGSSLGSTGTSTVRGSTVESTGTIDSVRFNRGTHKDHRQCEGNC